MVRNQGVLQLAALILGWLESGLGLTLRDMRFRFAGLVQILLSYGPWYLEWK